MKIASAVVLLSWAGASVAASGALPPGVTQAMGQQGDTVFHGPGRCFKCHGPDGKGTQKGPSLVAPKKWTDIHGEYDEIVQVVTKGIPDPKDYSAPMPARTVAKLSDEDVRNVAAYVWTISR